MNYPYNNANNANIREIPSLYLIFNHSIELIIKRTRKFIKTFPILQTLSFLQGFKSCVCEKKLSNA